MKGKIIAITGGPRTGKSTLVHLLTKHVGAVSFLEGEEFPKPIIEAMRTGTKMVESQLWFRNKIMDDYKKAQAAKTAGKTVILDTFFLTTHVYIQTWVQDTFEKELLLHMSALDADLVPWPDLVVSLSATRKTVAQFVRGGGRDFEDEAFLDKQMIANEAHDEFFAEHRDHNILYVQRDGVDYHEPNQLEELVVQIEERLQ